MIQSIALHKQWINDDFHNLFTIPCDINRQDLSKAFQFIA
ncbi:Uncharacterised protein [Vibrio cholerae]|nr:Uncharacterised protein [Vibrio cholerae]CSI43638.1 Uncharacterised protein [Vibrio cholerae]CSI44891.1 Uncharacterised protein [Vibrio cholerae]